MLKHWDSLPPFNILGYLNTLGNLNTLSYLNTLGYFGPLVVSQCRKVPKDSLLLHWASLPWYHWYLDTLGHLNILGYLITFGYTGHLVSQCRKSYLNTLSYQFWGNVSQYRKISQCWKTLSWYNDPPSNIAAEKGLPTLNTGLVYIRLY